MNGYIRNEKKKVVLHIKKEVYSDIIITLIFFVWASPITPGGVLAKGRSILVTNL